jgi:hypothetical protein
LALGQLDQSICIARTSKNIWDTRVRFPNANDLSFFEQNSSGVNTPIPKMQIAYTESMALASLYLKYL